MNREASLRTYFLRHVRCLSVMLLTILWWTGIAPALLGLINRRVHFLKSVFYCYAGNLRYANHYCYSWAADFYKWRPSPIGVFRQGGSWGLMCASPVTEREFHDLDNRAALSRMLRRVSRIRHFVGAEHVSFAGVLPSYLQREQLEPADVARQDRTGEVVATAVRQIQAQHFPGVEHDVLLMGGAGKIGREVHALLKESGLEPIVLDPAANSAPYKLTDLREKPALIVDMSRRGVLELCVDELPSNAVFLNEVFPEPPPTTRQRLRARGITAYHLAGVAAEVYPSLPFGYRNAVPCCAMHGDSDIIPVLRKLS